MKKLTIENGKLFLDGKEVEDIEEYYLVNLEAGAETAVLTIVMKVAVASITGPDEPENQCTRILNEINRIQYKDVVSVIRAKKLRSRGEVISYYMGYFGMINARLYNFVKVAWKEELIEA